MYLLNSREVSLGSRCPIFREIIICFFLYLKLLIIGISISEERCPYIVDTSTQEGHIHVHGSTVRKPLIRGYLLIRATFFST